MKKLLYVSAIALVMALPAAPVLAATSDGSSTGSSATGSSSMSDTGGSSMTGDTSGAGANAGSTAGAGTSTTASRLDPSTIRSIQQALNSQGFSDVAVDGQWGSSTQTALLSFQREQGLTQTGQPDTQTLQALGVDTSAVQGSGTSTGTGSTGMSNDSGMSGDTTGGGSMGSTGGGM